MKKRVAPGMVCALVASATLGSSMRAGSQDRDVPEGARDRFIGAWRLVDLQEADANGSIHKADCTGLLVFTREGRMSVQVMYRDPQAAAAAGPVQYAQGGYEATFGRYEIGGSERFTYHVEGAMVRSLVGKELERQFELSGKRLTIRSANPNEHWRATWEHY